MHACYLFQEAYLLISSSDESNNTTVQWFSTAVLWMTCDPLIACLYHTEKEITGTRTKSPSCVDYIWKFLGIATVSKT